jgi:hypothetical protein
VPTIVEIARRADVPIEGVLRVLNRERVSKTVAERVNRVLDEFGAPEQRVVATVNVLAARSDSPAPTPTHALEPARLAPPDRAADRARTQLVNALARVGPDESSSASVEVMPQALGIELRPVAEHVAELGRAFEDMRRSFLELRAEIGAERQEKLSDLALTIDLIVTSWRTVDRRLGRVEQIVQRLPAANGNPKR